MSQETQTGGRTGRSGRVDRLKKLVRKRLTNQSEPNSLRVRLLVVSALAMAPVVIFASALALRQAGQAAGALGTISWVTAAVLPVLFGVGGCIIVAIAAEAWVLRWLLYFERVAKAHARGHYSVRPAKAAHAPAEFRALGAAVEQMSSAVQERDGAVRRALQQQTMVLREIHHRVKNNLQIVGSLLSLQASRTGDPKVREALTDALVRIDAMALGQRFMQDDGEPGSVLANELFDAWAKQIRARLANGPRRLVLQLDVSPALLSLDLASPMVLIATEALMQAYHRATEDPLRCLLVVLIGADDAVTLTLSVQEDPQAFAGDQGVSGALMQGYVRQIRGKLALGAPADTLTVRAPLAAAA